MLAVPKASDKNYALTITYFVTLIVHSPIPLYYDIFTYIKLKINDLSMLNLCVSFTSSHFISNETVAF